MSASPSLPHGRDPRVSPKGYHPFLLRDARYDAAGNVILLPREPEGEIDSPQSGVSAAAEASPAVEGTDAPLVFPELSLLRARLRTCGVRHRGLRTVLEISRFAGNFVAVFLVLFLALNASSYFRIARARLLPDADAPERHALEAMTQSALHARLLAVPRLPSAGTSLWQLTELLAVASPDARLIIPKLAKNVPLVTVSDAALRRGDFKTFEKDVQDALRFGVVLYPGTARPGEIGNAFITGHSAYVFWDHGKYKEVFALLHTLEPGDTYAVSYAGNLHHYRVVKKFEVSPTDVSVLDQPEEKRMSTLMTCTPVGTNLRRLIVQAEEVDPVTGGVIEVAEGVNRDNVPRWHSELPI